MITATTAGLILAGPALIAGCDTDSGNRKQTTKTVTDTPTEKRTTTKTTETTTKVEQK